MAMFGSFGGSLINNITAAAAPVLNDGVLNPESFEIREPENHSFPPSSSPSEHAAAVVAAYARRLAERADHHLGHPYNLNIDSGAAAPLLRFPVNNHGDPFAEGGDDGIHSRPFEVAVLDWFARLYDLDRDLYWGYVANSGTDANLHGIRLGRERFPNGVVFYSEDTHFSIVKAVKVYEFNHVVVDTQPESGAVSLADLRAKLLANAGGRPAIVNVNIGTWMKGGVDDLDGIISILHDCGFDDDRFYIHCDAALAGRHAAVHGRCAGVDVQEGDREHQRVGAQVRRQPGAVRGADREERARQGHGGRRQPERARTGVPVVRADEEGPPRDPRRCREMRKQRALPPAQARRRRRQRAAESAEHDGGVRAA